MTTAAIILAVLNLVTLVAAWGVKKTKNTYDDKVVELIKENAPQLVEKVLELRKK